MPDEVHLAKKVKTRKRIATEVISHISGINVCKIRKSKKVTVTIFFHCRSKNILETRKGLKRFNRNWNIFIIDKKIRCSTLEQAHSLLKKPKRVMEHLNFTLELNHFLLEQIF